MITFVALLTFGAVLALLTALFTAAASMGWAIAMGLALVLIFVAFGFRKQLADIVNAGGTGAGRAVLVGAVLTRGAGRFVGANAKAAPGNFRNNVRTTRRAVKKTGNAIRRTPAVVRSASRTVASDVRGAAKQTRLQGGYMASHMRTRFAEAHQRSYVPGVRATPANRLRSDGLRPGGLRPGPQRTPRTPGATPQPQQSGVAPKPRAAQRRPNPGKRPR